MSAKGTVLTVMGISPDNPHFDRDSIAFALDTVLAEKESVLVFIADVIDEYNYLACGKTKKKALPKALTKGRHFKRIVEEICARRGYSCGNGASQARVRIIDWNGEVARNRFYKRSLEKIRKLYNRTKPSRQKDRKKVKTGFRAEARRASSKSIESLKRNDQSRRTQKHFNRIGKSKCVNVAVNYLKKELAFVEALPRIFGCDRIEYVYHQKWPVFEKFISGEYDNHPRPELGFRIITNKPDLR